MAKRVSEENRVLAFFANADLFEAGRVLESIKAIVSSRRPNGKVQQARRPKKAETVAVPVVEKYRDVV